jgi:DNA-binding IscR family transcriptional regulator
VGRAPCVLHDAWEEELSTILEYLGAQTLDEFVAGTASGKLFSQTLHEDRPPSTG